MRDREQLELVAVIALVTAAIACGMTAAGDERITFTARTSAQEAIADATRTAAARPDGPNRSEPAAGDAAAHTGSGDAAGGRRRRRAGGQDGSRLIGAARICYLEATWRRADCAAMIGAARRQAARIGGHWTDALDGLSVLRHAQTARAREVAAFPWGDVPGASPAFNRRWRALRRFVVELDQGAHADPCPGARWWGGRMDQPRGSMVPAECAAPTANTFYVVRGAP